VGKAQRVGRCRICGKEGELTEEHIPPQKAFNDLGVLLQKMDAHAAPEARFVPAGPVQQGGNKAYTLCAECNNNTGGWYGRAYVEFAYTCAPYGHPSYADRIVEVTPKTYVLRVAKEALAIMCSCCSAALTERHKGLKQLLLDKSRRGLPAPLSLFAYVKCDPSGRSSGVSTVLRTDTGQARVVAEFAWWPLGFVLSFTPLPVEGAADITHWLSEDYYSMRNRPVALPCRWGTTPYPLDYRSPAQVLREMEEDRAL
jgi:hypothetical protein